MATVWLVFPFGTEVDCDSDKPNNACKLAFIYQFWRNCINYPVGHYPVCSIIIRFDQLMQNMPSAAMNLGFPFFPFTFLFYFLFCDRFLSFCRCVKMRRWKTVHSLKWVMACSNDFSGSWLLTWMGKESGYQYPVEEIWPTVTNRNLRFQRENAATFARRAFQHNSHPNIRTLYINNNYIT